MAKALLACSANDDPFDAWKRSSAFLLRHNAEIDKFCQYSLTNDPKEVDIILFAEMGTWANLPRWFARTPTWKVGGRSFDAAVPYRHRLAARVMVA